jgi:hypothetical protein
LGDTNWPVADGDAATEPRRHSELAFDRMPWSGMIELVCDLIDHAYRDWP